MQPKDKITYSADEFPIPTFHCAECGHDSEGFSLCLKCKPQTYKIVGIDKVLAPSVFEKEVWNAAIEAAALELNDSELRDRIRKLKK